MPRVIGNYMITQRRDGHYYVRLQDGGNITHIYAQILLVITRKPSRYKMSAQFIGNMLVLQQF